MSGTEEYYKPMFWQYIPETFDAAAFNRIYDQRYGMTPADCLAAVEEERVVLLAAVRQYENNVD